MINEYEDRKGSEWKKRENNSHLERQKRMRMNRFLGCVGQKGKLQK